ncbi:MAG: hypothetical protein JWP72_3132 [Massilia sp.]|nr:hypothetical protein [Massilia sp.]
MDIGMDIGTIIALACRPAPGAPPAAVDSLRVIKGAGILGGLHADAFSPRQLLLASRSAYDALGLAPHALRENLLVDVDTAGLASGTVLRIGSDVSIRLMFQCEACGGLDRRRPGLARVIGARRGILARVVSGGMIRRGDAIRELETRLPAWPEDWRARVALVLDAVPPGSVIEYRHLARLAGIQSSYCRAFPRVIDKLGPGYAGKAVASQSSSTLPRWEGSGLFER